jgi:cell division protein FtsX
VPYSLREALAAFRRTPLLTALSVLAIGLSLFVVGLFTLAAFNVRMAIDAVEERVEIVAYLQDGATEQQIGLVQSEIESLPEVLGTTFISRTEALATAVRDLEEFREVFSDLEVNPLPASIEVRLQPGHRNTDFGRARRGEPPGIHVRRGSQLWPGVAGEDRLASPNRRWRNGPHRRCLRTRRRDHHRHRRASRGFRAP